MPDGWRAVSVCCARPWFWLERREGSPEEGDGPACAGACGSERRGPIARLQARWAERTEPSRGPCQRPGGVPRERRDGAPNWGYLRRRGPVESPGALEFGGVREKIPTQRAPRTSDDPGSRPAGGPGTRTGQRLARALRAAPAVGKGLLDTQPALPRSPERCAGRGSGGQARHLVARGGAFPRPGGPSSRGRRAGAPRTGTGRRRFPVAPRGRGRGGVPVDRDGIHPGRNTPRSIPPGTGRADCFRERLDAAPDTARDPVAARRAPSPAPSGRGPRPDPSGHPDRRGDRPFRRRRRTPAASPVSGVGGGAERTDGRF